MDDKTIARDNAAVPASQRGLARRKWARRNVLEMEYALFKPNSFRALDIDLAIDVIDFRRFVPEGATKQFIVRGWQEQKRQLDGRKLAGTDLA